MICSKSGSEWDSLNVSNRTSHFNSHSRFFDLCQMQNCITSHFRAHKPCIFSLSSSQQDVRYLCLFNNFSIKSIFVFRFIKVGPQQGSHLSLSIAHYKATNHIALFHSPYLFMPHKNYPPSSGAGVLISPERKSFPIQSVSGNPKCNTHIEKKKKS